MAMEPKDDAQQHVDYANPVEDDLGPLQGQTLDMQSDPADQALARAEARGLDVGHRTYQPPNTTPADMLERAMQRGVSADALEKFMDLYERWVEDQARRAFYAAMAKFRAECPEFEKDGHVRYMTNSNELIEYWHPTLGSISNGVNPVLGRHGLGFTWKVSQGDQIEVTVEVFHEGGHVERTTLRAAPDQSGKKNAIQQVGSTITYLERYTLQAALGIATTAPEEDDDARNAFLQETLAPEQVHDLKDLLRRTGKGVEEFLQYAGGYETLEEIPAALFPRLKLRLNERLEKLRAAGKAPDQQDDWDDSFVDVDGDEGLTGDRDE